MFLKNSHLSEVTPIELGCCMQAKVILLIRKMSQFRLYSGTNSSQAVTFKVQILMITTGPRSTI